MAYEVEWAEEATDDLRRTVSYLLYSLSSREAAASFKVRVNAAVKRVAARPLALPKVPDAYLARRGYRRAMAGSYLLLFRVVEERARIVDDKVADRGMGDDGVVRVLHVFHSAQDYPGLM
ncbi:MAG: type II toxin-antitoxin system RelE/ParE family toxin [Atopobiaceae bacterium]|jgi:plasmid stabilization system protein ParE|nr:type II toxin-antitoxin system RelE/ParE family toxin [Atopobiaceae bacterium]